MQVDNSNNPIDEYPIWEQREIISFSAISTSPNFDTVDSIVKNFLNNNLNFAWEKLDISDEALAQKKLRDAGIQLLCYNLNVFPASVAELKKYSKKLPIKKYIKNKIVSRTWAIRELLRKSMFVIFALFLFSCLVYYKFDLIGWSLLAAWLIVNTAVIVAHEYWGHNYITPKNKFIGYILDLYGGLIAMPIGSSNVRQASRTYHSFHHRYFPGDQDLIQYELANNNWFQYLFRFNIKTNEKLANQYNIMADHEFKQVYDKLDPVEKFFDKHTTKVLLIVHLILLTILGFHFYVYFVLVPIQCRIILIMFSEVITHKINTIDQDMPWAYPLVLNTAWHNRHHRHVDKLVLGPMWSRYINPQYYFIRLFYKVNTKII